MSLDDMTTTHDETSSEQSCSGCSDCDLTSPQQPPPSPPTPPAPTQTISASAATVKKQQDHEHGRLHWTACYITGCRYHRDEDKAYQPRPPRTVTCLYCDREGHKEYQCPDKQKSELYQRLAPSLATTPPPTALAPMPPLAPLPIPAPPPAPTPPPTAICQYCRQTTHKTENCPKK